MAKKHENYLKQLFEGNSDIYVSTDLLDNLCEKFEDCTRENARKIIQVSVEKLIFKSTKHLKLPQNKKLYYSNSNNISFDKIKKILKDSRPGVYRVIKRLNKNGGIISYIEILKLGSPPINKTKTKAQSFNELLSFLQNIELNELETIEHEGVKYLAQKNKTRSLLEKLMSEHNKVLKFDCMFFPTILIWLQKFKIINSHNGVIYRNKKTPGVAAIHNNLAWDAFSYTNTTGYSEFVGNKQEEKETLVVLDIKINGTYDLIDLQGFYDRIQIHRNSVKNKNSKRKVLPIVVTKKITNAAYNAISNLNFLFFDFEVMYGKKINKILENLESIYLNNNILQTSTEESYKKKLAEIISTQEIIEESGQEDNLGNIKGELFERTMHIILQKIYIGQKIIHSFSLSDIENGKKRIHEYDFKIETDDEIIIVEVKGYKGSTRIRKGNYDEKKGKPEKDTIKWFFSYSYQFIKEKFKNNPEKRKVKACYITTSQFDEEALLVLEEINGSREKPKDLDVYYDGNKLIQLLKKNEMENEIKMIKKYYKPIIIEE